MSQATEERQLLTVDHRQLTKEECLTCIGMYVGFNGAKRTRLRKRDLNSIYWYLTGETAAPWIDFDTKRSPDSVYLRERVADAVGFHYSDDAWVDGRLYRRNELRAILYALRSSPDKREVYA